MFSNNAKHQACNILPRTSISDAVGGPPSSGGNPIAAGLKPYCERTLTGYRPLLDRILEWRENTMVPIDDWRFCHSPICLW